MPSLRMIRRRNLMYDRLPARSPPAIPFLSDAVWLHLPDGRGRITDTPSVNRRQADVRSSRIDGHRRDLRIAEWGAPGRWQSHRHALLGVAVVSGDDFEPGLASSEPCHSIAKWSTITLGLGQRTGGKISFQLTSVRVLFTNEQILIFARSWRVLRAGIRR
jgi:hypothetical protein